MFRYLFVSIISFWFINTSVSGQEKTVMNGFIIEDPLVDIEDILPGGPDKDGVPAIQNPQFLSATEAKEIKNDDRVLGLLLNGTARAYPLAIMNYHEIVNDVVNGQPMVITFCPQCNTGIAFDATINGEQKTFGVSGLLYYNDILLYDQESSSLWSQIMMQAISGPNKGAALEPVFLENTTWEHWLEMYPNSKVLSRNTGHDFTYEQRPPKNYALSRGSMFPPDKKDTRLPEKSTVLGIQVADDYLALPYEELAKAEGSVTVEVGGTKINVEYNPKSESAVAYNMVGNRLPAMTAYWFAWVSFYPETKVWTTD